MSLEAILPLLEDIQERVTDLEAKALLNHRQTVVMAGLSDITERLGLIRAGEFRTGNSKIPGDGFTGVRIGYPGWTYNGETWNLVGVNNDVLQAGLRATDGKFLAGAGAVVIDANGITLTGGIATPAAESDITWVDSSGEVLLSLNAYEVTAAGQDYGVVNIYANPDGDEATGSELLLKAFDATAENKSTSLLIKALLGNTYTFTFSGGGLINHIFSTTKTVFNEDGNDIDFRIESSGLTHAFFVDAGADAVVIGESATQVNAGGLQLAGYLTIKEDAGDPTADTGYAKIWHKSDNRIYWQDGDGTTKTIHDSDDTVDQFIALTFYDAEPARASVSEVHGGLLSLATAQPLDSVPTNLVITKGIGKILIVINAGSDISGEITITGTSVDRNTGATTGADTDTITVDALTTDGSDTDSNGNTRYSFTGAYISSKWFVGSVTLSTTNLTLTDVDVYHVSFEQMNDQSNITITTFDANILTTNVAAEFDAYLYCLEVTGDKADIARIASLNVGTDGITALANKYERLRRGALAHAIDGSTDGIWVNIYYSNSPAYVEDVTLKVWATKTQLMTLV